LADDADLLRRSVPPAGKVLVACPDSAVLHLASGRCAAFPASLFQMVRMEEFRDLGRVLAADFSIPVLVNRSALALEGWQAQNEGLRALVGLLGEEYEVTAATGRSVLFVRRT